MYHYTECGLNNIYLINGYNITKNEDGSDEVFINDIHGLHKAIGMVLISKSGLLLGGEIKFIRTILDLSQTELARLLGLNYQSVLSWEKNKSPISKTADHLLRAIFLAYLDNTKSRAIYDKINEIADAEDQDYKREENKLKFKEETHQWHMAA